MRPEDRSTCQKGTRRLPIREADRDGHIVSWEGFVRGGDMENPRTK